MEQIKLRAWCDENNEMYYADHNYSFRIQGDGVITYQPHHDSDELQYFVNRNPGEHEKLIEVLLSTGRKDKNEVEIWEGDVLRNDDPECFTYVICEYNDKNCCFEINGYGYDVYMGENSQEVESTNITSIMEHVLVLGNDENDIEVIGNIYQHPHLLNT